MSEKTLNQFSQLFDDNRKPKKARVIKIERKWSMPSPLTFKIKPIAELLLQEVRVGEKWLDPFARDSKIATITNDVNESTSAMHHMDALDFLSMFDDSSVDGVLFDPPYSLRQVKECYDKIGRDLSSRESNHFFSDLKKQISRVIKPGGKAISFGWNSGGIGKNNGFEIERILLVPHGGPHHDTIVVVDRKGAGE
tara:strand:- start:2118 stop:2702 length:585 start_codon:yes stop_codon:yes gene_type:complete